jgi:hypothetical protein
MPVEHEAATFQLPSLPFGLSKPKAKDGQKPAEKPKPSGGREF